jgi:malate synthase
LLVNNGLHIEIVIDHTHVIGATDKAGISDIILDRR